MDQGALIEVVKQFMMTAANSQVQLTKKSMESGRLTGVASALRHRSALGALGDRVLVSVVVPTMPSRRWAHRSLYECFRLQSWPRREMVVLETGGDGEDSAFWRGVARADRRVRYIYERKDMALGPKRNRFLKLVEGEVVAQFDDDDVYAPSYLDTMVAARAGKG